MGRRCEGTILLTAALGASLLIASCGGSNDGPPAGGAPPPSESSPELVIRAISGGKGQAEDGLFALEPLLPGDDPPGDPVRLEAEGFSGGDAQFPFVYTQGTVVFRCSSGVCALNVAKEEPAVAEIGEAWCLAPSATPGRVWLAELDPNEPPRASRIGSAREVDVSSGEVQAEIDVSLPNLFCPVGSFDRGLLFQDEQGLVAIDVSGDIQRIPDHFPVAADGTRVVSSGDRPRGVLRITDLEGGEERGCRHRAAGASCPATRATSARTDPTQRRWSNETESRALTATHSSQSWTSRLGPRRFPAPPLGR